jgi:hypothetical protein
VVRQINGVWVTLRIGDFNAGFQTVAPPEIAYWYQSTDCTGQAYFLVSQHHLFLDELNFSAEQHIRKFVGDANLTIIVGLGGCGWHFPNKARRPLDNGIAAFGSADTTADFFTILASPQG